MIPSGWVTSFFIKEQTLIVSFPEQRKVLSSAVWGGGVQHVKHILNHQVRGEAHSSDRGNAQKLEDPSHSLRRLSKQLGINPPIVGLMTAVDLKDLIICRQEFQGLWVEGFFTVGVSNAVTAGDRVTPPPRPISGGQPGTINIILVTNVRMRTSAMVGAIGVATESKSAVLYDQKVRSISGLKFATGTGTDAIVFVAGLRLPSVRFSGTHTKFGELVGQVVANGVAEGLKKFRLWESRSKVL